MKIEKIQSALPLRLSDKVKTFKDEALAVSQDAAHFDVDEQRKKKTGSTPNEKQKDRNKEERKEELPYSRALMAHNTSVDVIV